MVYDKNLGCIYTWYINENLDEMSKKTKYVVKFFFTSMDTLHVLFIDKVVTTQDACQVVHILMVE